MTSALMEHARPAREQELGENGETIVVGGAFSLAKTMPDPEYSIGRC